MKLALLIIFISATNISASLYSQITRFNMSIDNKSVKQVFKEIENQSTFRFLYNDDFLDLQQLISLDIKNESIESILDKLLKDANLSYRVLNNSLIVITPIEFSIMQQVNITGTITDATNNEPLVGVNVVIRGTTVGVVSDVDGNFSISVPNTDAILVFSFVGYNTEEVQVGQQSAINVKLIPDIKSLDEVIIVAYGIEKRSSVTGSIGVVKGDDLKSVVTDNISKQLQSKVAGVFISNSSGKPGSMPTIRIRGKGSLAAGNDPLWVVDGIIYGNETPELNPNEVESMSVLKDASATSLYGSRASNGVILVNTKKGKSDVSQIDVKFTTGISQLNTGNFKVMDSQQYWDYRYGMYTHYFDDYERKNGHDKTVLDLKADNAKAYADLSFANKGIDQSVLGHNTDWLKEGIQNGITQDINVSYTGGNEKTRLFFNTGYFNEKGAVKESNVDKYSARFNIDHTLNSKIKINAKLAGQYTKVYDNGTDIFYSAFTSLPWDYPRDEQGKIRNPNNEDTWWGRDWSNYLFDKQYNYSNSRNMNVSTDLGLEYKISDNLSFTTSNRAFFSNYRYEYITDSRSIGGAEDIGAIENYYLFNTTLFTNNILRYTKDFGAHAISALIGQEYQKSGYDDIGSTGKSIFIGTEILSGTAAPKTISGNKSEEAYISVLSKVSYSYNQKYFADFSFRRDGSSKFGPDNRYGNFYSIGTSWAVHKESFFENLTSVNELKLRLSYGSLGNASIPNYRPYSTYSITGAYNGQPAAYPKIIGNPKLTWESNYETNFGFDLRLFNRITINLDLYDKQTKDLLLETRLPGTSGLSSNAKRWDNVGAVQNRGIEITVSPEIIKTTSFNWAMDFNISFNKNKVTDLNSGVSEVIFGGTDRKLLRIGKDADSWYLKKWTGVDEQTGAGMWELQTKNPTTGAIEKLENVTNYTLANYQICGTAAPKFTGGFSNTISYKFLTLNMNFNFVYDNKLYHESRQLYDNDGAYDTFNAMILPDNWSRWEKPGDKATHPITLPGSPRTNRPSSRFLEDGSFLRMRNITLTCLLPKSLLKVARIKNASIYVSGENLWTLTNFSGTDPEVGLYEDIANGKISGVVSNPYPMTKKVIFGLNLTF